ncbi:alpha/beta hydrolase family protein [Polaribacter sp.]|uniref:alpha/beta hydrolase family protein n=1 Tax=Polaribacter sp. TaxID=1920175 RepID=UPI003F6C36ED
MQKNKIKNIKTASITFLLIIMTTICSFGQIVNSKIIDNGGSGLYKAVGVTEKTLSDFVVYRPLDIKLATKTEGKLPIIVWANGGCMDSSIHHERLLTEVASHGYLIIAIGKLQRTVEEREHKNTPNKKLQVAIDWITEQVNQEESDYYQLADIKKIAACGMSCGGAQVMAVADDKRIKKYMMFNSGMGDMTMAGASKASLKELHGEIIYILGGETDVAYHNALLDFKRINNVSVVFASLENVGHGGTFNEEFGGDFARLTLSWLDWQFKSKDNSNIFLKQDLSNYKGWTLKNKTN